MRRVLVLAALALAACSSASGPPHETDGGTCGGERDGGYTGATCASCADRFSVRHEGLPVCEPDAAEAWTPYRACLCLGNPMTESCGYGCWAEECGARDHEQTAACRACLLAAGHPCAALADACVNSSAGDAGADAATEPDPCAPMIEAGCPATQLYVWPWGGGPGARCWCMCGVHEDCPPSMPACGTELTGAFPDGWPLVCQVGVP